MIAAAGGAALGDILRRMGALSNPSAILVHMPELVFPADFLWGAATAAHQVEGGNHLSDWWDWELLPGGPCLEPSSTACDHYRRFDQDIALLADLGLNTYRFSIEWARIEPSNGSFDPAELDHYRRVVEAVRSRGLTPMATLNHFTLPRWIGRGGGWRARATPRLFERYTRRVVAALGDTVNWYCTINEPGSVAFGGYLGALGFPPGTRSVRSWRRSIAGLVEGHRRARDAVKELRPTARVGATHAMQEWEANDGGRPIMEYIRGLNEDVFLEACGDDDFIGVQTYTRVPVTLPSPAGPVLRFALAQPKIEETFVPWFVRRQTSARLASVMNDGARLTKMGYEFRPQAIAATVRRAAAMFPGKDLVVTEHGVATDDDEERIEFIVGGLAALHELIAAGLPVRGYIHWSLLDNFEWARGYEMRFGLIGVDRATQERIVRPSARLLGSIARAGRLSPSEPAPTPA